MRSQHPCLYEVSFSEEINLLRIFRVMMRNFTISEMANQIEKEVVRRAMKISQLGGMERGIFEFV